MGVPLLDFSDLQGPPAARDRLVTGVGEALQRWGFVAVEGHDVPDSVQQAAYHAAEAVFSLPPEVLARYETPEDGRQRGYTSFGVEHAKDQPIADLKEFWHVGRAAPAGADIPSNRFPAEVPSFERATTALFDALDRFSERLLTVVATFLELPEDYFVSRTRGGNSLLRVIHYPPLGPATPAGAVRAAAHEDVNLLTVLPASTAPGLELCTPEGAWVPVAPPPGALICDTGDMMALVTRGRLPATTHRVVNPRGTSAARSRYALPFFVHPRPEIRLDPLDGTLPGPTASAFLRRRLEEIGLT